MAYGNEGRTTDCGDTEPFRPSYTAPDETYTKRCTWTCCSSSRRVAVLALRSNCGSLTDTAGSPFAAKKTQQSKDGDSAARSRPAPSLVRSTRSGLTPCNPCRSRNATKSVDRL